MTTTRIFTVQPPEHVFSAEQMSDIISTAFEGGINYWCIGVDMVLAQTPCELHRKPMSEAVTLGATLILYTEEDTPIYLSADKLQQALTALSTGKIKDSALITALINESYDAGDADCLIQYACFGEIVYG